MSVNITRGGLDRGLEQFVSALEKFQSDHPNADISLYRHGKYSVRIRIVDQEFAGKSKSQRHRDAWPYLAEMSEDTLSDLSTLVLLTPDEKPNSIASLEFDDPVPAAI